MKVRDEICAEQAPSDETDYDAPDYATFDGDGEPATRPRPNSATLMEIISRSCVFKPAPPRRKRWTVE
jgi:hypothetical protein